MKEEEGKVEDEKENKEEKNEEKEEEENMDYKESVKNDATIQYKMIWKKL